MAISIMKWAEAIENVRRRRYAGRRECIKKKVKEISTLCDIDACMLYCGTHVIWETLPENRDEVDRLIKKYRTYQQDRHGVLSSKKLNAKKRLINSDDYENNHKATDYALLREVEDKMEAVNNRIEWLNNHTNARGRGCGTIHEEIDQGKASSYGTVALFHQGIYGMKLLHTGTSME